MIQNKTRFIEVIGDALTGSHPPPQAGCPLGDPGPLLGSVMDPHFPRSPNCTRTNTALTCPWSDAKITIGLQTTI